MASLSQLLEAPDDALAIAEITPPPGTTLRELTTIEVQFDRPVTGVNAADLLINGVPASDVAEFGPGQFVFSLAPLADGDLQVAWQPGHGIADRANPAHLFSGQAWAYTLDSHRLPAQLMISEFMADNDQTLRDDDGDNSDWIELFNADDSDLSLQGWSLTDDPANLAKWRFPDVAIGARSFLLLYASGKNRIEPTGRLHTNFRLTADGEYLALVSPAGMVLSEFAPAYPPQRTDISYGRVPGAPDTAGYFARPTPEALNSESGPGFAPEVSFSRATGTFMTPFQLTLTALSRNAVLRYTLDGTLPTNSSPVYLKPILITNSVQVRVRAYQEGLLPGPPRTGTYLLLSSNVLGFNSDLPVIILHSIGKGAPSASRQNFVHVSVYEPRAGLTWLTNLPTLVSRAGIKMRGSSTQGYPKSSFALELWDEFNQDERREILGLPAESDWVLYAPNNYDPVLIHNPFIHQLSRDMGRYSSRTRFVEVYLNRSTGAVTTAHYNGIYVLEEKIKIGPNRVDIDRLKPEHVRSPEVTGGYLLKIDRLDPGDSGFSAGGQRIGYVDPKEREVRLPQRAPQGQYLRGYFDQFSRALNGTNWLHPTRGYRAYVDVDAWIDFHVLELLSGNVDALVLSSYFHKPRDGKIVYGPHWDFDRALGSTDGRDSNPRNWVTGPFFSGWWSRLFRDPDFWQQWIDRYQELRQSHFSQTNINSVIDRLADEVRQAQPRERQKWRVALRGGSYQSEVNLMKNWLSNRTQFIDRQLVSKPQLSAAGGRVPPGFELNIAPPANATVYFTLDGSDPRAPQGSVSSSARVHDGPIAINETVRVTARSRNLAQRQTGGPPISSPWSGPAVAIFTVKPPPMLLTELMFHPLPFFANTTTNASSDLEFLELMNVSGEPLPLAGYHFTQGLEFSFSANSSVNQLAPGERLLLVKNSVAFRSRYPTAGLVAGEFTGSLGNRSQRLTLTGPRGEVVFDFTYQDQWHPLADGLGFSIVPVREEVPAADLSLPTAWRLSGKVGGSPGAPDPLPPAIPRVVVNELLPNPLSSSRDMLELLNTSSTPADLSGWYLTDDFRDPKKFRLPSGLVVPPSDYLFLTSFASAEGGFAFSKFGEQVYLFSADASGELTGWAHGFSFGAAEQGVSFGRVVSSTAAEAFVAQGALTFGWTNSGPRIGPIVLSEIMAQSGAAPGSTRLWDEYIELWNATAQPVALYDPAVPANTWQLRGAVDFDFPANIVLGPNRFLVVVGFDPVSNPAALARFRSRYGMDESGPLLGPWQGSLGGPTAAVRLSKPGETQIDAGSGVAKVSQILVEQVSSLSYMTTGAHRAGLALVRSDTSALADDPANWTAALPNPGTSDADADGLGDHWELAHGLDPFSPSAEDGGAGDPDRDGFTNRDEFLAGTAPRDPASALRFAVTSQNGLRIVLNLGLVPGRSYTLQSRDGLAAGEWQTFQQLIAGAGQMTIEVPASKQGFYRLTCP